VWQRVVGVAVSLLVAGFVAVVLADPTSDAHEFLDRFVDMQGWVLPVIAGVLLGAATFIVMRNQGATNAEDEDVDGDEDEDQDLQRGASRPATELTRGEVEPPGADTAT
jgi:CsoR family transcriptional regulator, copper-sensing transcriptional repressor